MKNILKVTGIFALSIVLSMIPSGFVHAEKSQVLFNDMLNEANVSYVTNADMTFFTVFNSADKDIICDIAKAVDLDNVVVQVSGSSVHVPCTV